MPSRTLETNGLRVVELPMSGRLATRLRSRSPAARDTKNRRRSASRISSSTWCSRAPSNTRPRRILNRSAERLGTDLNGLTTDDYVELSAVVRAESAMPTLDLVTDIAGQALLGEEHVEAERAVILQEIADDKEDPGTVADDRLVSALVSRPSARHAHQRRDQGCGEPDPRSAALLPRAALESRGRRGGDRGKPRASR